MAMQGRIVLVTGAGSGMGRLACRMMAAQGAQVAALDRDAEGLAATAAGAAAIFSQQVDVTDFAAVKAAVELVESSIGPVHRVYHCAAIMPLGKLLEQDNATVHRLMDINYGGLVNVAQAALPAMVARGAGDFISFSSLAGWLPMLGVGAYNASKFAVSAFTEVLYHENLASGVRFACVCPPPVATPLLRQGFDTGMPKTIADIEPIEPQVVLDAIEAGLAKGEFWIFPGKGARRAALMRRLLPGLCWKGIHEKEGY
jgi:NAD(P)-dependent dehydrogenase (short-subunit alcohol dehydrogenase family)